MTAPNRGAPDCEGISDESTVPQTSENDLAYDDKGDFASLDEWYPEDANYDKLGDDLFEKVMSEHRPERLDERLEVGGSSLEIESDWFELDDDLIVVD